MRLRVILDFVKENVVIKYLNIIANSNRLLILLLSPFPPFSSSRKGHHLYSQPPLWPVAGVAENELLSSTFEALLKARPSATKEKEEKSSQSLCRTRLQRRRRPSDGAIKRI
ncbi:hypothetical protein ES319_A05G422500v1 [Gossypium barbadense]|uniref:Uncharacterized protein n=1 Tax=Gossypium barbadense TaxID=3634 RepID=A0A5J5W366_GOSBA|nr:hypothetical protein ES319_A05G422500v1 [Gossypium barbadense]